MGWRIPHRQKSRKAGTQPTSELNTTRGDKLLVGYEDKLTLLMN